MKHYNIQQVGFTLIELMIVISISAMLAAMALPSFAAGLSRQSTQKGASSIVNVIDEARAQAALTGKSMNLVITPDLLTYNVQYTDKNGVLVNTTQFVLSDRLQITSNTASTATAPIVMLPSGEIVNNPPTLVFRICDSQFTGEDGYVVSVNNRGISRIFSEPTTGVGDDGVSNRACN